MIALVIIQTKLQLRYHDKLLIVIGLWYINRLSTIQYGIHNAIPKLKSFIIIMINSCCKYKWCYSAFYQIEWHCIRGKTVKNNIIVSCLNIVVISSSLHIVFASPADTYYPCTKQRLVWIVYIDVQRVFNKSVSDIFD